MRIGEFSVFVRNDTCVVIYGSTGLDAGGRGGVFGPCSVVFNVTLMHISFSFSFYLYNCIYSVYIDPVLTLFCMGVLYLRSLDRYRQIGTEYDSVGDPRWRKDYEPQSLNCDFN